MRRTLLRLVAVLALVAVVFSAGYFTGQRYALRSISVRLSRLETCMDDLGAGVERAASAAEDAQSTAADAQSAAEDAQTAAENAESEAMTNH